MQLFFDNAWLPSLKTAYIFGELIVQVSGNSQIDLTFE